MKKAHIFVLFFAFSCMAQGQALPSSGGQNFAELGAAAGSYRGSFSISYFRNWRVGAKKRIGIGLGGRATSFLGKNLYYVTAPASITSESTSPFIFFKENIAANIDSLLVKTAQVNMMNVMLNIDYRLSPRMFLGFNIDLLGFSFGGKQPGNFMNGATGKNTSTTPTPFNVLLISDNDRGSLNSEFYLRYWVHEKWSAKLGAQFLFTEYTTETKVQQYPEANDRFRNKSLLVTIGATYSF
jgi:hypothetical protein